MEQRRYKAFISSFSNDELNSEGRKLESIIYQSDDLLKKMKKHLSENYCIYSHIEINEGDFNHYLFMLGMQAYNIEDYFKKIYFNNVEIKEKVKFKNYSLEEVYLLQKSIKSGYSSLSKLKKLKDFLFQNFSLIRYLVLHDDNFNNYLPKNYDQIDLNKEFGEFDEIFNSYNYKTVFNNFILKFQKFMRRL